MKSLVLKDLYNISHNMKSLIFVLVVLSFALMPTSDVMGYIFAAAVICSTMVVTTFTFDEMCRWDGYAMVMPLSRRDIVAGKFVALLLFSAFGALVGMVMGVAGGILTHKLVLTPASIGEVAASTLVALLLGMTVGGLNIPLILKFGPEKARLMLLISALVPTGLIFGGFGLMKLLGIPLTERTVIILLFAAPFLVAAWDYIMFRISCRIFEKKEL